LTELPLDESDIVRLMRDYGVTYVVNQPNFWDDLASMQRLQKVLTSEAFERVHVIDVTANTGHNDRQLQIYRNTQPVNTSKTLIRLELPIITAQ
jgi:hypothetical protein